MGKKKFVDDESDEVFQSKKGQMGVDDMVMLPKINEGEIVSNLKKRYDGGSIYTNIGPVLLSVNPYRDLGITGQDYILMYQHKQRHENPPHIYALAEETYRTMRSERENQCCIISGESGAGKTVAAKHIMQYVAAVSGKDPKIEYVKSVILDSNPLLEAFGNAKTLRNDNSSRFGKYFEIQFDGKSDPCGGHITVYLLEKSRVIGPGKDQRNFHFFYQFLAGASQDVAQYYQLYSADNFYYLNQSGCYTVDTIDDVKDYAEVLEAMNVLGFDQTEQGNVHGIVAAILHLGNVAFHDNGKGGADVSYPEVLQLAATYFQVDPSVLNKALTFRVLNTGGGGGGRRSTYNVPQNPEQAGGARDALARDIYSKMFEWLVTKVNTALNKYQLQSSTLIAILDIYGFEIFEDNSFEQFCINYVNEKLQQYFIELTLKAEQDEYQAEGIQWQPIPFFNNQVVCDLIEGKRPPGIFLLLDDVCATVHAESGSKTDYKFLEKIGGSHGNNPHYRAYSGAFGVKHYAGDVVYNVVSFCDKNKDTLFADIIEVMQCSQNPFIVSLFPEQTKNTGGQKKRPTTAGFKIKTSCNKLMAELSKCTPHYVRCLKPNDLKKANNWNAARVKHQCKYLGLLENVKVRRAGFAYRAPYDRFLRRYKKLSSKTWGVGHEWTGAPKDGCLAIVGDLRLDNTQYQCGRTKMFIRHPETVFHLEEQLERLDFECCVSIQKAWRAYTAVKHALEMQAMASDMFKNKKERQRTSQNRTYDGDYGNFDNDFGVQQCFQQYKDEEILFYDTVKKVNRRGKQEDRQFVITEDAYYIIAKAIEKKQVFYKIMRRVKISELQSMSLSTLADNFFVLHSPGSYDNLLWNDHKTEIAIILWEQYKAAMNRDLPINFNNQFQYKLKTGKMAKVTFKKDEKAQPPGVCKGSGLGGGSITITIASGLPSSTDTTPQGYVRGAKRGGGGAGRGGGGGGGGGFGAPQQQQQPMMQQQQAQPMMQQQQQPMGGGMRGGGGARGGRGGGGRGRGGGGRGGGGGAPQGPRCRALYAYQGTTPDELTFNEGDIMLIKTEDQGGWMECELQGRRGWAPSNYVQKI